jgi:hypothetical protein
MTHLTEPVLCGNHLIPLLGWQAHRRFHPMIIKRSNGQHTIGLQHTLKQFVISLTVMPKGPKFRPEI